MEYKTQKKQGDSTREKIIATALLYSEEFGYSKTTKGGIAKRCGLIAPNITYYFGKTDEFHDMLMREAITRSNYIVIAQGIAAGDPIALGANDELKRKALEKVSKCHYMKRSQS